MQQQPEERTPLRSVPDLRGTGTQDASGVGIGRLWGSLAEADTGLLRYLDLQLERLPRHVLVPIGHARLREVEGVASVRLRAALLEDLEAIPEYDPGWADLLDPYEQDLLELHGRAYHGEHYYAHPAFDHTGLYAGAHPIVHDAPAAGGVALLPLAELPGYQVAAGEPDIRGWELTGFSAAPLGRVTELIVAVGEEKVRYAVVGASGRQVLVPIGFLSIEPATSRVRAASLRSDDLQALPGYAGGGVDRAIEDAVRATFLEQFKGQRRYQLPDYSPRGLESG